MSLPAKPLIVGLGLVLAWSLSFAVKSRAEALFAPILAAASPASHSQMLPKAGPVPPPFTLGYDRLLADYYWLSFVSYIGDGRAREADKYVLADRYLDLVTRLDPRFAEAYWFCAFSVGADEGRPDLADKIIDRGIAANPYNWSLPFIAGFNQYLFAGDEARAARYYRMAARFPEAPPWLADQAVLLERGIPRIYKQIGLWEKILSSQKEPLVREKAHQTLKDLWLTVYKNAPDRATRQRAADALATLEGEPQGEAEYEAQAQAKWGINRHR